MVRPLFFASVWCLFAAAAPVVGPELPLAEPVIGRAGDHQQNATATARAGVVYVAWEDRRDGRSTDLWGARVSGSQPLDRTGVPLVRGALTQSRPALALATDTLLLVWVDAAIGTCGGEVQAQRFDASFAPLGAAVTLSTGACGPGAPALAADAAGTRWLVTWGGHGAQKEVHGAVVLLDGTVAQADFAIGAGPNSALAPAVVATSSDFLVAWEDDRLSPANILLAPVSVTGTVGAVSAPWPSTAQAQRQPTLSISASVVLLAWAEGGTELKGGVLTEGGFTALGPFTLRTGSTQVSAPRAFEAASGAWFVAWNDQRSGPTAIYGRRVDASGSLSAELNVTQSGFVRSSPVLAQMNNELLVVFHGDAPDFVNGLDVMGTRVVAGNLGFDPTVSGTPGFPISTSATRQRYPNAAWNGEAYFVGWRDDGINGAGADLVGQLLTPSGQRLLPDAGVRLTVSSAILGSYASVAGNDAGFFVTWGDNGSETSLRGRRVTSAGVPLDSPAPVLNDRGGFVIDHDSRWFIDSWVTVFKQSFNAEVSLRRTAPDAGVAEAEVSLGNVASGGASVRMAQSGEQLLVVLHGATDAGLDVVGALWRHDAGVVLAPTSLTPGRAGNQTNPCVAGGPSNFLVAWSEAGSVSDIYASRVSQAGQVLDAPVLLSGAGVDAVPTATWTGSSYLVAWLLDGASIVGVRVGEDGTVLDASPFVLSTSAELQALPRLVTGAPGESLLTYEVFDATAAWNSFAARARVVREMVDAGVVDAGVDSGVVDAGVVDAGESDAGVFDAGVVDAGAGEVDAGTPSVEGGDGGVEPPEAWNLAVGCGCGSEGALGSAIWLVALVWRRRAPGSVP